MFVMELVPVVFQITDKENTVPILNINQSTDSSICDVDTIGPRHSENSTNALSSVSHDINLQESVREEEQSSGNEHDNDSDGLNGVLSSVSRDISDDKHIRGEEQSNDSGSDRVSDHYLYSGDIFPAIIVKEETKVMMGP